MEQIIVEVQRRRHDQFLARPCEEVTVAEWSKLPFSVKESSLPPGAELVARKNIGNTPKTCGDNTTKECNDHPFLHSLIEGNGNRKVYFYALPSIAERIQGLYRTIPSTHPFNDDLRNLVVDLKKKSVSMDHNSTGNTNPIQRKRNLLKEFSSVTYAHRMHASLLSRCTINLNPLDRQSGSYQHSDTFITTLEQYMGDVLSARILMGHSYFDHRDELGFIETTTGVEGGPSIDQWIDALPHPDDMDPKKLLTAKDWYRYWVFFHSTLLRVAPMSIAQAQHLKLEPLSGILEPYEIPVEDPNESTTRNERNRNRDRAISESDSSALATSEQKQHPPWFIPSRTYSCFSIDIDEQKNRMLKLLRPNSSNMIQYGYLETTFYEFGPLGPSFRGRDSVRTEGMYPHKLFSAVMDSMCNREEAHTARLSEWLAGADQQGIMRWMKLLQDESQKIRPMTVQSPLVTIRMMTRISDVPIQ